jgi:hypothetical protein
LHASAARCRTRQCSERESSDVLRRGGQSLPRYAVCTHTHTSAEDHRALYGRRPPSSMSAQDHRALYHTSLISLLRNRKMRSGIERSEARLQGRLQRVGTSYRGTREGSRDAKEEGSAVPCNLVASASVDKIRGYLRPVAPPSAAEALEDEEVLLCPNLARIHPPRLDCNIITALNYFSVSGVSSGVLGVRLAVRGHTLFRGASITEGKRAIKRPERAVKRDSRGHGLLRALPPH